MPENFYNVHCDTIDKEQLYFTCPNCWSLYKKDGTPKKTARRLIHKHGSNGDLTNRNEQRIPHCLGKTDFTFNIIIDDQTIRKF